MSRSKTIQVENFKIVLLSQNEEEYISLTDMARYRDSERTNYIIQNWMRTRNAIEFVGLWEMLNNPIFKSIEFDAFKNEAGSNSFALTPQKWVEATNAIGIISKSGRYGGTFAHRDIAFEFASWISPSFKLYLIKEFQRLKEDEHSNQKIEWSVQRTLAKVNYQIHADAIKENLIPKTLSKKEIGFVYASEADLLNMALFGTTARQWKESNPGESGNIRDSATLEQLVVLSNLESINALLIHQGLPQHERLLQLNLVAISQMKSLINNTQLKKMKEPIA
ncbi:KilA-N domain-containing protein [Dyadobacter sp. CY326]|uniref:KilA-N domain-containing protein n=1 Tax=Dyadobacter sp. CY326 TaxID=2907300 RepID=UPI001F3533AE|nr:KilA-N domain-containing protein [Dyadobacter sp. CY326]MCE7066097.1 KilA-N domain-containing protein [Dyadobacter sp. CY326]